MTEEQRLSGLRETSIAYVECAKRRIELASLYASYTERNISSRHTVQLQKDIEELDDMLFSLDTSLGLLAEKGDSTNVKEYQEALKY